MIQKYSSLDSIDFCSDDYFFQKISNLDRLPEPDYVGNNVSDFSGWIFKCTTGRSSSLVLKNGIAGEAKVCKAKIIESRKNSLFSSEWSLIYQGTVDRRDSFTISDFKVRDEPIKGAPDFAFENKSKDSLCIVEIKFSDRANVVMPVGGWPNARAQLWLYSKIDEFKKYKKIYLACEQWGNGENGVARKGVFKVRAEDPQFNRKNMDLFALYKSYEFKKASKIPPRNDVLIPGVPF